MNTQYTLQQIVRAIRKNGLTARVGFERPTTLPTEYSNVAIVKGHVLILQVASVLGFGSQDHPDYAATKAAFATTVEQTLVELGIKYIMSSYGNYILTDFQRNY